MARLIWGATYFFVCGHNALFCVGVALRCAGRGTTGCWLAGVVQESSESSRVSPVEWASNIAADRRDDFPS
jgi:hypothetical protein